MLDVAPVAAVGICLIRNWVTTAGGMTLLSTTNPVISIRSSISCSPAGNTELPRALPIPNFFTFTYTPLSISYIPVAFAGIFSYVLYDEFTLV